jgi:hypothetical protein
MMADLQRPRAIGCAGGRLSWPRQPVEENPMRRRHLFEIEDQPWCPGPVRDALTDYLQFTLQRLRPYASVMPRLEGALTHTGSGRIIDLCAGSGGSWPHLLPSLSAGSPQVRITLTDKYPNLPAWQKISAAHPGQLSFHPQPVDVAAVPADLHGFRTLYSSFHHFRPAPARAILADAVRRREGIGIFEFTHRSPQALLIMCFTVILVLLATPFIRPFRWSRILWTYLLPLVPLVVLFDGLVSCLRTYTPAELRELAAGADPAGDYVWESGEERARGNPIPVTYLIGYPRAAGR